MKMVLGRPVLRLVVIGLLFAIALGLRLYNIDSLPMDVHVDRQYHAALIAQGFHEKFVFGESEAAPPDGIIEPPILEAMTSLAYYVFGGEYLWIPRLLSAVFWMVGGVFLYLIARSIASPNAAVFSTSFYLFDPYSVLPSRAFQPDPLMIMMLLFSVFAILRYHRQPSTHKLVAAAMISSLALFIKPGICLFQVFGLFISLTIYREGIRKSLLANMHLLTFAVLSLLPMTLYYLYGTLIGGYLEGQVQTNIVPELIWSKAFWIGWLYQIKTVVGFVPFLGALLGVLLLYRGPARALTRALIAGLWIGYFLFGLVFTLRVPTIPYYSLQLIPVVALSLCPVWELASRYLRQTDSHYIKQTTVLGLFFLAAAFSVVEHRAQILGIIKQGQGEAFPGTYVGQTNLADYEGRARTYEEIGEVAFHSRRVLVLAPEYGVDLLYHGQLLGGVWAPPTPAEAQLVEVQGRTQPSTEEMFDALYSEYSPDYFIVIKRFAHYGEQIDWDSDGRMQELRTLLTESYPTIADNDTYVVFDLETVRNGDPGR